MKKYLSIRINLFISITIILGLDAVMSRADKGLYTAKNNGKDSVHIV